MTYERRSHYEYGDPVAEIVARDEARDHARAPARGQRVALLAEMIVSAIVATGMPGFDAELARGPVCRVLADALYGNASLDIPPVRKESGR